MAKSKSKFNSNKFKNNYTVKSDRYNYDPETEVSMIHHKHPVFCFKYLMPKYGIDDCTNDEKLAFLSQICRLSQLDWHTIENTDRHKMGTEKINVSSIKSGLPSYITEDVTFLLAFRFIGKAPFLVYRDKFLAHVIFIDPKFKLYKH